MKSLKSYRFFCLVCGFLLSLFLASVVITVLIPNTVRAQDSLMTIKAETSGKADSAVQAAKELQAKAIADSAREQVIEIIGEKRYQKNKKLVESRLVNGAAKFIPFVNPERPVQQADGTWTMAVEMRVSTASLRKMVLEAGLLSDAEGPASILPLVGFTDRRTGSSLRWWLGEGRGDRSTLLSQVNRSFSDIFQAEFSRQGFHLIKPAGMQTSPLPEALRMERPSGQDLHLISRYFKSSLAMKGDIRFRASREVPDAALCTVKLQVVQGASGRSVAEVTRAFEVSNGQSDSALKEKLESEMPEMAKDLAVQVLDAWQRGTLNANLIRLAVRGTLSPQQIEAFKTSLLRSVREVKSVKERLFEAGQIHFEVDYTGEDDQLASRLKNLQMPKFATALAGNTEKGLVLDVTAR